MKLYVRYLLSPYFKMFALLTPVITGIYLLVEFFDKLDNVTNAGLPFTFLLHYLTLRIPQILFEIWPVLLSLAGLLALAFLARGGELLAFRTLGFSSWRLAWPYLFLSLFLTLVFVGVEEKLLPGATYKALYLWTVKVKKKEPRGLLVKGKLFFRGVRSFFVGQALTPWATRLKDVVYAKVDEQGKPQFIIWAKEASYQGGKWIFKEGLYKRQEENFVPRWFQKETLSLEFSPDTVLVVKRIPRTQHLKELWTQRSFLKKAGLSTRAPDGEMAYRLFYPLAAPGLLAIALPVLLGERGRHALGKGLSLGLLSIFLGLAGFMALKGIADTGHLSPLVALPGGVLGLVLVGGFLFWWRRF